MNTPRDFYLSTQLSQDEVNQLIINHLPLVKHIISRMEIYLPSGMDKEDLVSIGNWGLIEAANKFDPTMKNKFHTYAYQRVRGAILDEIRNNCFGGQTIVRKQKQLNDVYERLYMELGRIPTDEDVAQEMGITLEKLDDMLSETSGAYVLSLDHQFTGDETNSMYDYLSNEEDYLASIMEKERTQKLIDSIDQLKRNEKLVLSLYYEEELSLKEISMVMNLTESRISQIHKKAILKLRTAMKKDT